MNPRAILPVPDPSGLPGPPWLLHLLWVATFFLHLSCVAVLLGGSTLSTLGLIFPRIPSARRVAGFFHELNPWVIALAITFGIAPLLFFQVLFGQYFYSATILIAPFWLGLPFLLLIAYSAVYWGRVRLRRGGTSPVPALIQTVCLLLIAAIQVSVSLIHRQPAQWPLYAARARAILGDPGFAPRYFHFLMASAAAAGAVLVFRFLSVAKREGNREECVDAIRFGLAAILISAACQITFGSWLLLAEPKEVLRGILEGGVSALLPLVLGALAGLAALVFSALALAGDPLARPNLTRRAGELIALTFLLMVITRHRVRQIYLSRLGGTEHPRVEVQSGAILAFLLVFLGTVATLIYILRRALRDRPNPGKSVS